MKTFRLSALTCVVFALISTAAVTQTNSAPTKLKDEMRMPWQRVESGYLRHWLVLGEFPNPNRAALDVDFLGAHGGEAHIQPVAGMTHPRPDGSQAIWTDYVSDSDTLDLAKALPGRPSANVVAYAYTTVDRAAAGKVLLSLGSDDGVAVWVNGVRVHRNPVTRAVLADEDQVEANMHAGANDVLVKVEQGSGGWGFIFRILEPGIVRAPGALSASIEPADPGTLLVKTNWTGGSGPVKVEVVAAGGAIRAVKTADRGASVAIPTTGWPDGPYDIRVTAQPWAEPRERAFLSWYKGDALPALKKLVATAPKAPFASAADGHHAMLAEMVMDRTKGKLDSLGSAPLPTLYSVLMEFAELQQQRAGGNGPVHASGFVRLAYQDDIDGSTQFCRAYLPGSYDPAKKWPLVLALHGYNPDNPVYVNWWSADTRHNALAERHDIIFGEPHGRGNTSYQGIGERDVLRCLELAKKQFHVDDDRVYLTGASMGGGGTWWVGSRHPELFAAIAPVFGGWDYHVVMTEEQLAKLTPREHHFFASNSSFLQAESLLNVPIFVNHGDADQSVDVNHSRYAVRMLQRWGYDIRYREHPGKGHTALGNDDEVIEWFLEHKRDANPKHVRVRADELQSAAAYWLRIDQRADQREFMLADAEVVGPNAIRLDTDNVVAVTLSPATPLVDRSQPLRISWNGTAAESVGWKDGRISLRAADYAPARLHKNSSTAGPIQNVMRTPFAVVLGTIAPDAMTRELCQQKAQAIASNWNTWQHQPLRIYKDTEIPEADVAKYSLVLVGGAEANAITKKLAGSLPLKIAGETITIDNRSFMAPDAAVLMAYPHPLNPERYVLVAAATSPAGMYFLDLLNDGLGQFDFVVTDGAVANSRHGRPAEKVRVAAGWFDNNWRISDDLLDQADPEIRARCPMIKVRPDRTTTIVGLKEIKPEIYEAYVGDYQAGVVFKIANEGGHLVAHVPNQPDAILIPESETEFSVEGADVEVSFVRDPAGKVTHANVQMGMQPPFLAKKIE